MPAIYRLSPLWDSRLLLTEIFAPLLPYTGNKMDEIWEGGYKHSSGDKRTRILNYRLFRKCSDSFVSVHVFAATSIVGGIRFAFDGTLLMIDLPSTWLVSYERRRLQFSSESRRIEIKNIVILILKNQLISNIKKIRKLININRYKYSISKSIPINFNYQKNLELIIKFILIIILPCHPLSFVEWITFELIHSLSTLLVRDTNIRTKPATEINDGEG